MGVLELELSVQLSLELAAWRGVLGGLGQALIPPPGAVPCPATLPSFIVRLNPVLVRCHGPEACLGLDCPEKLGGCKLLEVVLPQEPSLLWELQLLEQREWSSFGARAGGLCQEQIPASSVFVDADSSG